MLGVVARLCGVFEDVEVGGLLTVRLQVGGPVGGYSMRTLAIFHSNTCFCFSMAIADIRAMVMAPPKMEGETSNRKG